MPLSSSVVHGAYVLGGVGGGWMGACVSSGPRQAQPPLPDHANAHRLTYISAPNTLSKQDATPALGAALDAVRTQAAKIKEVCMWGVCPCVHVCVFTYDWN